MKKLLDALVNAKTSIIASTGAMLTTFFMSTGLAYAANDPKIFDNLADKLNDYYLRFVGLSTAIAIFLIVVGVIWIMISPSSKGAATPLGWVKKIIVAWVVIQCLGGLFTIAENVIDGDRTTIDISSKGKGGKAGQ